MSIISVAIATIYEQTGELATIHWTRLENNIFRASLRVDESPLFDPLDGIQELCGFGTRPHTALMRLEVTLDQYFSGVEQAVTYATDVNRFDVFWDEGMDLWRAEAFKGDESQGEGLGGSAMGAIETWAMLAAEEEDSPGLRRVAGLDSSEGN